jgi:hypothetical protein
MLLNTDADGNLNILPKQAAHLKSNPTTISVSSPMSVHARESKA